MDDVFDILGISEADLATIARVDCDTLAAYRRGDWSPSAKTLTMVELHSLIRSVVALRGPDATAWFHTRIDGDTRLNRMRTPEGLAAVQAGVRAELFPTNIPMPTLPSAEELLSDDFDEAAIYGGPRVRLEDSEDWNQPIRKRRRLPPTD